MSDQNLVRVYSDHTYSFTTTVRHQGVTVAFAMDKDRRIYYSVLGLAAGAEKGEFDAAYWHDTPAQLRFPAEIAEVGYFVAGVTRMPVVKSGGRVEAGAAEQLDPAQVDTFLSSTARLTAAAPFQVVSDDRYLVVFRQSVAAGHGDAVFKLKSGGSSGDPGRADYVMSGAAKVPIVDSTLLCDRFVLVGSELKPVLEVRYQRSRNSSWPASSRDTPGTADIEGRPFYEPTQELTFVKELADGAFSALLLPTEVHSVRRWQIFAHNSRTKRVESFNVEQAANGLFNTRGTRSGTAARAGGTGLRFDGKGAYVDLGNPAALQLAGKSYTIEAWVNPAAFGGVILAKFNQYVRGDFLFWVDPGGFLVLRHNGNSSAVTFVTSTRALTIGRFTHVAAVVDGGTARLYLDGEPAGEAKLASIVDGQTPVLIGGQQRNGAVGDFFTGDIDEIRIWGRARGAKELAEDRGYRLVGDEPGLLAYYRCDEAGGTTLLDQSGNGLNGTLIGNPQWVTSTAPVGDHPGMRRDSFAFTGRTVVSGLAAVLYHQQEDAGGDRRQPMKRQARVLLTAATAGPAPKGGVADRSYVAALDLAVGRDGRLALVPGDLTLAEVNRPAGSSSPEEVSALEQSIAALKARIAKDEAALAGLGAIDAAAVAVWDRDRVAAAADLAQIDAQAKLPTSWYYRIMSLQESVYLKCSGEANDWYRTVFSTKDATDPKTLWRLEDTGVKADPATPFYLIRNVVPDNLPSGRARFAIPSPCAWGTRWGPVTGSRRIRRCAETSAWGTSTSIPVGVSPGTTGCISG